MSTLEMLPAVHAPARPVSALWKRRILIVVAWAFVFGALLALYQPALRGGYLWDDNDNITKPELRSVNGLQKIWLKWGATQTYYPVLHTLYWLEYQAWGDDTLGYHVASLLFHSVSVVLVYLIVRRLQIPGALLAAALFTVHPVYVESLAWITEQKNTLSGMFSLAAVLAYLHFDENRRGGVYALASVLFLLALESKATAVTLPLALVVILWWKRGSLRFNRDVLPLAPWFAASLAIGMFTVWYERVYVGVQGSEFHLTPIERCLVASRAVWFYLGKLFWPAKLTLIYPRWEIDAGALRQYFFLGALVALFAAALIVYRRWRGPVAALVIFVGTLFPLLGFFNTYIFRYTYVCDHFQYLPSLPIVVLVSAGIATSLKRAAPVTRFLGQACCVALLAGMAFLTWEQSWIYRDMVTLFQTMIDRNPTCWMAYNDLGLLLANQGFTANAIEHYQIALSLNPDYAEAHNNLGLQLAARGQPKEAIEHYQHALALKDNYPAAHANYGNALVDLGRPQEAIQQYQAALAINPDFPMAHFNLANTLAGLGQMSDAIKHYRRAVELRPDYSDAHYNFGIALAKNGDAGAAVEQFRIAVQQRPTFVEGHNNLGNALCDAGRPEEAVEEYRQAMRLKPDDGTSYVKLTKTYAALNRPEEAIATAQKAIELARAQRDEALAKQIEDWVTKYRVQQASEHGETAPASRHSAP